MQVFTVGGAVSIQDLIAANRAQANRRFSFDEVIPSITIHEPVSNSEIKCFRHCGRKHHIQYVQLVRPLQPGEALVFGTAAHEALEAWWKAPRDFRLEAALQSVDFIEDEYLRARIKALVLGYHARWEAVQYEVIAVEVPFDFALPSGRRICGKIDAIARIGGKLYVVEHKTTSENIDPGSFYWARVSQLDTQVSTYLQGARSLGHAVEGCIYDVLRKPALIPLKSTPEDKRKWTKQGFLYANQRLEDETADEFLERIVADMAENGEKYFGRGEFIRTEDEESKFMNDLELWAQAIEGAPAERPRNPDACFSWNRECEYLPICNGSTTAKDETLYRIALKRHEEI